MSTDFRARLVPELLVTDIQASLAFWHTVLGFPVKYDRPEEGFAYLDLDGAQLMLCQRDRGALERRGIWDTGLLEYPFGRGINLEIRVDDLKAHIDHLAAAGVPLFFGPEERWYRKGATEVGVRQCLVQDPDGYLVRLQEKLGDRPFTSAASGS